MTLYQPSNSRERVDAARDPQRLRPPRRSAPQLRWRQTTRTVSPPSSPTIVGVHAHVLTYSRRSGAARSVVATLRRFCDGDDGDAPRRAARSTRPSAGRRRARRRACSTGSTRRTVAAARRPGARTGPRSRLDAAVRVTGAGVAGASTPAPHPQTRPRPAGPRPRAHASAVSRSSTRCRRPGSGSSGASTAASAAIRSAATPSAARSSSSWRDDVVGALEPLGERGRLRQQPVGDLLDPAHPLAGELVDEALGRRDVLRGLRAHVLGVRLGGHPQRVRPPRGDGLDLLGAGGRLARGGHDRVDGRPHAVVERLGAHRASARSGTRSST